MNTSMNDHFESISTAERSQPAAAAAAAATETKAEEGGDKVEAHTTAVFPLIGGKVQVSRRVIVASQETYVSPAGRFQFVHAHAHAHAHDHPHAPSLASAPSLRR